MPDLSGDPIEVPGLGQIRGEAATIKESTWTPSRWWLDGLVSWFLFSAFMCGLLVLLGVIV